MDWSGCSIVVSRSGYISGVPALRDDPRMPADLVVENIDLVNPRRTWSTIISFIPRRATCSPCINTP